MTQSKQDVDDESNKLHGDILAWRKWLTFFGAALLVSYVVYFGIILGQMPAIDSDKWGAFGDFFGGILNPIVAFAAFYWLTQSVKLQKQELAQTRRELQVASEAQKELVENGKKSIRLSALTSLVGAIDGEIRLLNERIAWLDDHLKTAYRDTPDEKLRYEKRLGERNDFVSTVRALEDERHACVSEMRQILGQPSPQ